VLAASETEVLEPRIMQVLVTLARRRGEVVSREDLVEECWAGRVVGEDAVSRCIARVRRLAEAYGSFSVETIPRVGYRLIESTFDTSSSSETTPAPAAPRHSKSSKVAIILVGAAMLIAVYFAASQWPSAHTEQERQRRVVTQVIALVQKDQYGQAFTLALPLLKDEQLKSDTAFAQVWRQIVLPMRPLVTEAGATVYFKPYQDADGEWVKAGVTPFTRTVEAPRGPLRVKVTKPGFRTGYFVVANPGPSVENDPSNAIIASRHFSAVPLPLVAEGTLSEDMVLVPRTNVPVVLRRWSTNTGGSINRTFPLLQLPEAR
jgi:DNA-binding winged helix-turn-helix (wHTH) protein